MLYYNFNILPQGSQPILECIFFDELAQQYLGANRNHTGCKLTVFTPEAVSCVVTVSQSTHTQSILCMMGTDDAILLPKL